MVSALGIRFFGDPKTLLFCGQRFINKNAHYSIVYIEQVETN